MPQLFYILFGAVFTVAVSMAAGSLLLDRRKLPLYREEHRLFAFVTGSACLSLIIFALCAAHLVTDAVGCGHVSDVRPHPSQSPATRTHAAQ